MFRKSKILFGHFHEGSGKGASHKVQILQEQEGSEINSLDAL